MTTPKQSTALAAAAPAALAAPMPLVVDSIEVEDAFDDDSLEMNELGDKFRVKRYHFARRLIAVSETTVDVATFTPITACMVPIPERATNVFYFFRGQIVWESSDVSEGMAVRMAFDGVLFGQHRYRVSQGDSVSTAVKTRFEIFGATPVAETTGPGPLALAWVDIQGVFSCEALSSGDLSFEVAAETGSPQFVKLRVGTFLEVMRCS